MKSFFSKLGASSVAKASSDEEPVQALLSKTQSSLAKLRQTTKESFPLLNESTRLVQELEVRCSKMPDGDMKSIWREQVGELQRDLQMATERMLSSEAKQAEPSGDLFQGMNMATTEGQAEPEPTGDLFSGLDLGDASPSPSSATSPPPAVQAAALPLGGVSGGPLPLDLFSGLEELTVPSAASLPAEDPFFSHAPTGAVDLPTADSLQSQALPPQVTSNPASQPSYDATAADGKRRKKITRRVGYARGAEEEAIPEKPSQRASPQQAVQSGTELRMGDGQAALPAAQPISEEADIPPASEGLPDLSEPMPMAAPQSLLPEMKASDAIPAPGTPTASEVKSSKPAVVAISRTACQPSKPDAVVSPSPAAEVQSPADLVKLAGDGGFEEQVNALEMHVLAAMEKLAARLTAISAAEHSAKQQRRQLRFRHSALLEELADLAAAEAEAVGREDFEAAGSLGERQDEVKATLGGLQEDVWACEATAQAAVSQRWEVAAQQGAAWQAAAEALSQLEAGHQEASAVMAARSAEAEWAAAEERAAGREHVEELRGRVAARQRWLVEEQAAVDAKIEEATRPAADSMRKHSAAVEALAAEVDALRAVLAEKESQLAEAQAHLSETLKSVGALSAKYDRTLARLQEDRAAVEREQAALEEEERQLAAAEAAAREAATEAIEQQQRLDSQLRLGKAASADYLRRAAATQAAADTERQAQALQDELRRAEQVAEDAHKEAQALLDAAQQASHIAVTQRSRLVMEANRTQERAAAARRQIPDLEAAKKAAAAARDFKEAQRLSERVRSLSAEAAAAAATAEEQRGAVAAAQDREQELADAVTAAELDMTDAAAAAALARWRHLQALAADVRHQLDGAVAREDFAEAEALQGEADALESETSRLAATHNFGASQALPALLSAEARVPVEGGAEQCEDPEPAAESGSVQAPPLRDPFGSSAEPDSSPPSVQSVLISGAIPTSSNGALLAPAVMPPDGEMNGWHAEAGLGIAEEEEKEEEEHSSRQASRSMAGASHVATDGSESARSMPVSEADHSDTAASLGFGYPQVTPRAVRFKASTLSELSEVESAPGDTAGLPPDCLAALPRTKLDATLDHDKAGTGLLSLGGEEESSIASNGLLDLNGPKDPVTEASVLQDPSELGASGVDTASPCGDLFAGLNLL